MMPEKIATEGIRYPNWYEVNDLYFKATDPETGKTRHILFDGLYDVIKQQLLDDGFRQGSL